MSDRRPLTVLLLVGFSLATSPAILHAGESQKPATKEKVADLKALEQRIQTVEIEVQMLKK